MSLLISILLILTIFLILIIIILREKNKLTNYFFIITILEKVKNGTNIKSRSGIIKSNKNPQLLFENIVGDCFNSNKEVVVLFYHIEEIQ